MLPETFRMHASFSGPSRWQTPAQIYAAKRETRRSRASRSGGRIEPAVTSKPISAVALTRRRIVLGPM